MDPSAKLLSIGAVDLLDIASSGLPVQAREDAGKGHDVLLDAGCNWIFVRFALFKLFGGATYHNPESIEQKDLFAVDCIFREKVECLGNNILRNLGTYMDLPSRLYPSVLRVDEQSYIQLYNDM